MSIKEEAIQSISALPDSASWEDVEEKIRFLAAIRKGSEDIEQGRLIAHEKVKKQIESWLIE